MTACEMQQAQTSGGQAIDPRRFRDACARFGTGVTVVTTHCDGDDHGMTANAFMSISLSPPMIAISIAETARILPKIRKTGRFAVSVLSEGMEDIAWHFAGKPRSLGRDCLRCDVRPAAVAGAAASFIADVADEIVAGDHIVFIGRVQELTSDPGGRPLLFFGGRFGVLAEPQAASLLAEYQDHGMFW